MISRLCLGFRRRVLVLAGGWLAAAYLDAAPTLGEWIPLFKGVDHQALVNTEASGDFQHLMVAHALRVDLLDPDIRFFSSPRIANYVQNSREVAGMTVSRFLKINHLQAAINANWFDPADNYAPEGSPKDVNGLAISEGQLVSPANDRNYAATLMIDAANHARIIPTNFPAANTEGVWTAIAGDYPVLLAGVNIGKKFPTTHGQNPRTAVGLSENRRYLYLLTIDGRQPGYSVGAYDSETAAWLQFFGAYDGINLDGGGSTTLSVEDSLGNPVRLNRPSTVADSGRERTVGSHFGLYAKPLLGFINDVHVVPDDETAIITWTTTAPATSGVNYGLTLSLGAASPRQLDLVTNHTVVLTGLQPGSDYYFSAFSEAEGRRYATSNLTFTTTNYFITNQVLALTDAWRFTSANLDGVNWTEPSYDDSAWDGPGAGLLWVDVRATGPNPAIQMRGAQMPFNPATGFPYPTYYFRTHFQAPLGTGPATLFFSGNIDDGAVLYLNGHELYRLRMEAAPAQITNDMLALGFPCDGDADCLDEFSVSGSAASYLVPGDNTLAVEVHNYNARSADITFGMAVIDAVRIVKPVRIEIGRANGQTTLSWNGAGLILQQTVSPVGPWTDVPGPVASPYSVDSVPAAQTQYFRLRR